MGENSLSLSDVVLLDEATIDAEKGELTLKVITAGLNKSKERMYPAAMLERDHGVFTGVKMFLDHPTSEEDRARPEGSLRNWVANLRETWWDPTSQSILGRAVIIDPAFLEKAKRLQEAGELGSLGASIRASGVGREAGVEGVSKKVLVVEKLIGARSVDFVTNAGAGGRALLFESDDSVEEAEGGASVELKELNEAFESFKDETKAKITELQEAKEAAEKRASDAETKLQEAAEVKSAEEKKAAVQKQLDEALSQVKLPDIVESRIRSQFADATDLEGLVEAVREEKDYLLQLQEAGVVTDLGNDDLDESEKDKSGNGGSGLTSVFSRLGLSESAAKIAADGRR